MPPDAGPLLGIDLGISVIKATLFLADGAEITAARSSAAESPHPGWVEKDANAVWQLTAEVVREVLSSQGDPSPPPSAVGICACGNGLILLDRGGTPLRPIILSNDRRAARICEQWKRELPERTFTHSQPYPGQAAALLAWVRDQESEVWSKVGHVLLLKDYIRYRLTGEIATDPSDLGATNLAGLEPENASKNSLLSTLGLDAIQGALPRVLPSASIAGRVHAAASRDTGIALETPVATGAIDCEAALVASGVHDTRTVSIIAGSWAINQCLMPSLPGPGVTLTVRSALPGFFTAIEGSPTSALNFDWFVNQLFATESARDRTQGRDPFASFSELAASVNPWSDLPFYLPFIHGSPVAHGASGGFFGITPQTGAAELARAVLEGVTFSHRWHLERLKSAGCEFDSARLAGGAARSPFWVQLFADTLALPMEIPEGREIGARGVALCAGVAIGLWPDLAAAQKAACKLLPSCEPTPAGIAAQNERYLRFLKLVDALAPVWRGN